MQLGIEEAEGSFRAPSICTSLMSLALEEDKNSDIKSWLEQSDEKFDKCFFQPKESSNLRRSRKQSGPSRPSQRIPKNSHQKYQPLPSQPQIKGTSKSPQRKNTGITFPKTNTSLQQSNNEPNTEY